MSNWANIQAKIIKNVDGTTLIKDWKSAGMKLVFTNGCFDLLHIGHIQYLAEAAELGDRLIVGVNSDRSVALLKGADRPIHELQTRMTMLAGLSTVDLVLSFDEETPKNLIKNVQPDVLVKGGDYTIEGIVGSDYVLSLGGQVKSLSFNKGHSTSQIINKIKSGR